MTDSVHPTPDELADFQASLLADAELDRVQGHVRDCPDCTGELAALEDVQAMLAETGAETLAMPDDVAAELDLAITTVSRERAAGVPSLDVKREQLASRRSGRTAWVWIGGAAAAAVVVIGAIGLGGLDGMQSNNSDDAGAGSAADSGGDMLGESEADSPQAGADSGGAQEYAGPNLNPDTLANFASKVSAKRGNLTSARSASRCAENLPVATSNSTAFAVVRWEGQRAVLVIDPSERTASVFGCGTGAEPLYSTSY